MDEQRLTALHEEIGSPDPPGQARSELQGNIPQLARQTFLRGVVDLVDTIGAGEWPVENRHADHPNPIIRDGTDAQVRLAAVCTAGDLQAAARLIAYETAFSLLYHLDFGALEDFDETHPNWALVELTPDQTPTGRALDALYEDLNSWWEEPPDA